MNTAKPVILLEFNGETVVWHSVGWGNAPELMAKAKRLINEGETPEEVIRYLEQGGFEVNEDHKGE